MKGSTKAVQHDEDALLNIDGAARLIGRSNDWVIKHTTGNKEPKLPFVRFGRRIQFSREGLRQFIADHSVEG